MPIATREVVEQEIVCSIPREVIDKMMGMLGAGVESACENDDEDSLSVSNDGNEIALRCIFGCGAKTTEFRISKVDGMITCRNLIWKRFKTKKRKGN